MGRGLSTDHAVIGDGRSAALVAHDGSIPYWCPARFDAEPAFLHLLDPEGGVFRTVPRQGYIADSRYVGETNVHQTDLRTGDATLALTTFMPYAAEGREVQSRRIIRILECDGGPVEVAVRFAPRFSYGRTVPHLLVADEQVVAEDLDAREAPQTLTMRTTFPVEASRDEATALLQLRPGDRHAILLDASQASVRADPLDLADRSLRHETRFWQEWLGQCTHDGPYTDAVRRSLLALKLLEFAPEGSFVAAPTFGLPERPGGRDNWDYRYTWLRDSAFIVMAFETMGYKREALRFRRWLARVVKRDAPDGIRPLYAVDGEPAPEETFLDHLQGQRDARPVRVGNRAVGQDQLDAYGDVMICFHRAPVLWEEEGEGLWAGLAGVAGHALAHWDRPDAGIWETPEDHQYTYSKGMVWLAGQRALQIAEQQGFEAPVGEWSRRMDQIRQWLETDGRRDGAFVQSPQQPRADGALLLFPLFGIHPSEDMGPTIERVADELASGDLLYRTVFPSTDGSEGAFLAVNFWMANVLALQGRPALARRYLEAAKGVGGALGLLPEEAGPPGRVPLGNYPLGLSHYSFLLAADAIARAENGEKT